MVKTRSLLVTAALAAMTLNNLGAQETASETLLSSAIRYHDPQGVWETPHELQLEERRPDGTVRQTRIVLEQATGGMKMERQITSGAAITLDVSGDNVRATLNGSSDISPEDKEKHRLTKEQGRSTRNYYAYLYGLPMKLRDPGTRLGRDVKETKFQEEDALEIRVTYDEAVGGDTWYFYFHPESHALIGYRFYHDESKKDGEYITLAEETMSPDGLRLPKVRKWYTHKDDRFLGTDSLVSLVPVH